MDVSDLGSGRKKRAHAKEVREKSILTLYNKLHELVGLLAELLNIQVLTDTAVLHASSMGVAPFFVESVSELQLSALKLVTTVSCKLHMLPRDLCRFIRILLSISQNCWTSLGQRL
jgi:cohesin loading factor subunit SCC2